MALPPINSSSDNFDIDSAPNAHSDGRVKYACHSNDWVHTYDVADDDVTVIGQTTAQGETLTISYNSDSNVPLWRNGAITLTSINGLWAMQGMQVVDSGCDGVRQTEWTFCNPEKALDISIASIECVLGSDSLLAETIQQLKAQKGSIIATSNHYATENDCAPLPPVKPVKINTEASEDTDNKWENYGIIGL